MPRMVNDCTVEKVRVSNAAQLLNAAIQEGLIQIK
jgi:hypothetical protein